MADQLRVKARPSRVRSLQKPRSAESGRPPLQLFTSVVEEATAGHPARKRKTRARRPRSVLAAAARARPGSRPLRSTSARRRQRRCRPGARVYTSPRGSGGTSVLTAVL